MSGDRMPVGGGARFSATVQTDPEARTIILHNEPLVISVSKAARGVALISNNHLAVRLKNE